MRMLRHGLRNFSLEVQGWAITLLGSAQYVLFTVCIIVKSGVDFLTPVVIVFSILSSATIASSEIINIDSKILMELLRFIESRRSPSLDWRRSSEIVSDFMIDPVIEDKFGLTMFRMINEKREFIIPSSGGRYRAFPLTDRTIIALPDDPSKLGGFGKYYIYHEMGHSSVAAGLPHYFQSLSYYMVTLIITLTITLNVIHRGELWQMLVLALCALFVVFRYIRTSSAFDQQHESMADLYAVLRISPGEAATALRFFEKEMQRYPERYTLEKERWSALLHNLRWKSSSSSQMNGPLKINVFNGIQRWYFDILASTLVTVICSMLVKLPDGQCITQLIFLLTVAGLAYLSAVARQVYEKAVDDKIGFKLM